MSKNVGPGQDTKPRRKPERAMMCNNDRIELGENLAISTRGNNDFFYKKNLMFF